MTGSDARVVTGTTYEALALLYRQVQADYGLTPLDESWNDLRIPDGLRPAADWFFRGDIALGMNLVPLACENEWHALPDLVAGVDGTDAEALASTMLRSPDTTTAEQAKREDGVVQVLAGAAPEPLLAALQGERFDPSAARSLLEDPVGARRSLVRLLDQYARVVSDHQLTKPLLEAAALTRDLLKERPLDEVAERLVPQWTFHDLSTFESVVLIPSRAITPFLSTRLTSRRQALIVFPVQPHDAPSLTDLVSALKTIAHPQRLEIVRITTETPTTGQDLARALGLTEATVHHHTSLLRAAGLVISHRDGHRIYLTGIPNALDELLQKVREMTRAPDAVGTESETTEGG